MLRSFLTLLVSSAPRSLLLAPGLVICLSCATPFPLENLEKGMTMEQATAAFGEPISTNTEELNERAAVLYSENAQFYQLLESAVKQSKTRGPAAQKLKQLSTETLRTLKRFVAELDEASGEQGVRSTWVYPHKEFSWWKLVLGLPSAMALQEVELLFEEKKLVSWETRPAPSVPTTGTYVYSDPFPSPMFPHHSKKDTKHHKRGHKHHHDDY